LTDLFYIEAHRPQHQSRYPTGQVGALVVTPLFTNNVTPFLRWMSGDLVTCDTHARGNGPFSVFPIVRHAHRTSGFFKIKGVNIGHAEFEDLLFQQREVNDFKCEAVTVRSEDALRVFVEIRRGCDAQAAMLDLSHAIRRTFELTPKSSPPLGTLAKEFEASIKAPRIVDRRENNAVRHGPPQCRADSAVFGGHGARTILPTSLKEDCAPLPTLRRVKPHHRAFRRVRIAVVLEHLLDDLRLEFSVRAFGDLDQIEILIG
jgi:hypothetical protein